MIRVKVNYISNKPHLVVEHDCLLMGFVGLTADATLALPIVLFRLCVCFVFVCILLGAIGWSVGFYWLFACPTWLGQPLLN